MVLCPDVFEANWAAIETIAKTCEDAVTKATTLYQRVPMVL